MFLTCANFVILPELIANHSSEFLLQHVYNIILRHSWNMPLQKNVKYILHMWDTSDKHRSISIGLLKNK